jgi:histidine phosphotransfer protein HptB
MFTTEHPLTNAHVPESDPINGAAYAALVETLSNDLDFVAALIETYVVDAQRLVIELRAAVSADRADDLARLAHELKSSSASLGAAALPVLCGDLEAHARAGIAQGAAQQVRAIEVEAGRVERRLRALSTPERWS